MKNIITIITTLAIILTTPVNVSAQTVNNTDFNSQIYNGSSAKCVSCSHSSKTYVASWSIKSISSSKKDNSATVNAVVVHTYNNTCKTNINKNVTITCSKNGTIS